MPIYEYQCSQCGRVTEVVQKISDAPLTDCPCGAKNSLHKLISHSSFVLKGSGWYVTDFRDKGGGEHASAPGHSDTSVDKPAAPAASSSSSASGGAPAPAVTPTPAK